MRILSFLLLTVLLSCNSKKEMKLDELIAAEWTELEPGISYIKTSDGAIKATDSVDFKLVGVSMSGMAIPTKADTAMTSSLDYLMATLKPKLPGRTGYLKIGLNSLINLREFEVNIFLDAATDSITHEENLQWLRSLPGVVKVEYTTREMAAKKFQGENPDENWDKILMDNPLPESYDITLQPGFHKEDYLLSLKDSVEQKISNIADFAYPDLGNNKDIVSYIKYELH